MTRPISSFRELPTAAALAAAICLLWMLVPSFRRPLNATTVGKSAALIGVMACGEGVVVLSGGLDLSVGAIVAAAACAAGACMAASVPWPLAALAGLVVAGLAGLFNGALITYRKLPPILTTLATLLLFRYGASLATGSRHYESFPDGFQALAAGWLPVTIFASALATLSFLTRFTRFGRWVIAIGGNEQAARLSGVPVDQVKRWAYVISGLCAGIAAIITIAFDNSAQWDVSQGDELYVIAACVVGGIRITGGQGSVLGAALGATLIVLIPDAVILLHRPEEQYGLITGAIILVAAALEQWSAVRAARLQQAAQ
ncbi:MAG TPA: ABC transporter permease [Chthonomonadales bacterium]|nr:ABC transporter permease [Chthonomonadales bacterium]